MESISSGVESDFTPEAGILYVVATPIGHRGDLSPRSAACLQKCSILACEDTRVVRKLLPGGTPSRLVPYHERNEQREALALANALQAGESVALVSDAGTPCISDPGFRLVREARRRGITVRPVGAVSATIAALSVSGLPTHGFRFLGFLPPKTHGRKQFFLRNAEAEETLVVYESPHRIVAALADAEEVLGPDRCICLARELTKLHETIRTDRLTDIRKEVEAKKPRGEYVLLVAPSGYEL